MNRVVVVAACGLLLAGCELLQTLQMPSLGGKGSEPITLRLETDPPGADANLSTGGTCVTPCALPVVAGSDITVSFSLPRYQPRSVTVRAIAAEQNFIGMESAAARFEPNPVYAELQPAAPPRKPRPKRPSIASKPTSAGQAAAPAAAPAPAGGTAASPAAPSSQTAAPAAAPAQSSSDGRTRGSAGIGRSGRAFARATLTRATDQPNSPRAQRFSTGPDRWRRPARAAQCNQ